MHLGIAAKTIQYSQRNDRNQKPGFFSQIRKPSKEYQQQNHSIKTMMAGEKQNF